MKKLTVLLIVSCLVSSALATWVDDFESYPNGWTAIPSPWETGDGVASLYIQPGGYLGSKAAGGASNWDVSYQWRAVDAGDTVDQFYAKFINPSVTTYSSAALHLGGEKNNTTDRVAFDMWDNGLGVSSTLRLGSFNYDNNVYIDGQFITVNSLAADTWYDVRITVSDNNYIGEYKAVSSSTWITVGTVTGYDNFAHNYVGIRANRNGRVDDVGYVPEPATMALLGLGGLSLLRRKKTA